MVGFFETVGARREVVANSGAAVVSVISVTYVSVFGCRGAAGSNGRADLTTGGCHADIITNMSTSVARGIDGPRAGSPGKSLATFSSSPLADDAAVVRVRRHWPVFAA